jgi:hypothetical protein
MEKYVTRDNAVVWFEKLCKPVGRTDVSEKHAVSIFGAVKHSLSVPPVAVQAVSEMYSLQSKQQITSG